MKSKQITLILIVSMFFMAIYAGMDQVAANPEKTQAIDLYALTRHDETILEPYEARFLELHPEVNDIKWLSPTSITAWRSFITSPTTQVDFLWGGGPTFFNILADEELLLPFEDSDLVAYLDANISDVIAGAAMKRKDNNGDYLWVAAAISSFGYTVNYKNLETYGLKTPSTWEELASPDYFLGTTQHAIGMGDAPSTTSNTRVYHIILQKYGWEAGWDILNRMAGNAKLFEQGSGPTRDSVITGEQAIAMTIDFYGFQAMVQNENTQYIIPEGQSIINADPIAISKGAKNIEYVEEFIKFVTSVEGQALWLKDTINRMPLFREAFEYSAEQLGNTRDDLEQVYNTTIAGVSIDFDEDLALDINEIMIYYFQGSFTKAQEQMYSAWESIVTAYRNEQLSEAEFRSLTREMSQPSITLADAKALQLEYNADTSIKDSIVQRFKNEAIERYITISDLVQTEATDRDNDGSYFDELTVKVTSPTENQTVSGTVDIKAEIVEYSDWSYLYGVTNVDFYIDNIFIGNKSKTPYTVSWDTTGYADGLHTIRVVAEEYAGRKMVGISQVNIGTEKTLPILHINSPSNGSTVANTTSIQVTALETTEYTIDYVIVEVIGSEGQVFFKNTTSGFGNFSVDWNTLEDSNGIYKIVVTAFYQSGNSQYTMINVYIGKKQETWQRSPGFEFLFAILSLMAIFTVFKIKRRRF